jgi:hypothetical protein
MRCVVTDTANKKKSRNRWVLLTAAVIALFSCCGCPIYFSIVPWNGIRVERLKADLEERLPEGSTREQAEAWFRSNGLETQNLSDLETKRWVGLAATVPNDALFEHAEIVIELYFDDAGKLWKRVIYRFVYSL